MSRDPVFQAPTLRAEDFEKFRKLAYEKFGLNLTEAKHDLVSARLSKKLREMKLPTYQAYYEYVVADRSGESLVALIDALSTNHTAFWREASHFEFLRREVIPKLRGKPRIDVWSAPCSTGEEAYTLAITMMEELGAAAAGVRVYGTDISTRALAKAQAGTYCPDRLSGVPPGLIRKYFTASGPNFQVLPEVRRLVEFERVNLIEPVRGNRIFQVIFCRNMLIYFDKPTQERVVNELARHLEPGGYLFVGHSESLMGIRQPLEYVKPAIYRSAAHRPEGGAAHSASRERGVR